MLDKSNLQLSNMLEYVKSLLDTHQKIYVAYSGGLDSTVLLHLASQLSNDLCAIHVNHNLSPNGMDWQNHCESICKDWNISFVAKSVQITDKAGGLEAQARQLRYGAIAEVIEPNSVVLTGQHQDDQVETFLLQLKRGAGPKGLSSMPKIAGFAKDSRLIRPLLSFSRAQLLQYAEKNQLNWIEDESNQDTRFDRNFIRHEVFPLLNKRWPGFSKAACRSIEHIAEQQQLVDEFAEQDLKPLLGASNQLRVLGLLALSKTRQRSALRYWIASANIQLPSQVILERMFKEVIGAKADANPKVQWAGYQLRRFRASIYILHDSQAQPGVDCELKLNEAVELNDGIGVICLTDDPNAEGLKVPAPTPEQKVTVRFDVQGLSLKPSGSKHTRKLTDLYKEKGVTPWQRGRTPLLFYNDELIAVGSQFINELAPNSSHPVMRYSHKPPHDKSQPEGL